VSGLSAFWGGFHDKLNVSFEAQQKTDEALEREATELPIL
jgi:hypothetical protein